MEPTAVVKVRQYMIAGGGYDLTLECGHNVTRPHRSGQPIPPPPHALDCPYCAEGLPGVAPCRAVVRFLLLEEARGPITPARAVALLECGHLQSGISARDAAALCNQCPTHPTRPLDWGNDLLDRYNTIPAAHSGCGPLDHCSCNQPATWKQTTRR